MAGSVTFTERVYGSVKLCKMAWTSDASGNVSGNSSAEVYDGRVIYAATVPDASAAPTDQYDVVVNDDNGLDVCDGALANRSASNTEYVNEADLGAVAKSKLTPVVSNAGNAKQGTIYLWIR